MLVRLLVAVSDPTLRQRLEALSTVPDLHVVFSSDGQSLLQSRDGTTPDMILVDATAVGGAANVRAAIESIRLPDGRPDILYFAAHETPAERAEALASGSIAVLDSLAAGPAITAAIEGIVGNWRAKSVQAWEVGQATDQYELGDFITRSPAMSEFMRVATKVARSSSSLLILGETGVGKERLANAIHASGPRREAPFVVVNCGAIPETLIESQLFGHERGAFTGADRLHRGHFEMAHGGTIFLDEIGEMPAQMQVKLLRALQEKRIQRVGSETPQEIDVRVIAATNRDLKREMESERFRQDLYYRLSVVALTIPPLRDRREDIPLIVHTYLERYRLELQGSARGVSDLAMRALQSYAWPGNVREVLNVVERAVLLCDGEEITVADLPDEISAGHIPSDVAPLVADAADPVADLDPSWFRRPLREARRAWGEVFERAYLEQVLTETRGRISETAERAGLDPRSLYEKMRRLGLRKEDFK